MTAKHRDAIDSRIARSSPPPERDEGIPTAHHNAGHATIVADAAEAGGTSADLDPEMEAAAIEHLLDS